MPDNDDDTRSGDESSSGPKEGRAEPRENDGAPAQPENRRARRAATATSRKKGQRPRVAPRPAEPGSLFGAGEVFDDAFSRAADGSAKWVKAHFNIVQWLIIASIAGWVGWEIHSWRADKTAAKVSDALADAVGAEFGRIGPPDEEGKMDSRGSIDARRVFSTDDERLATAASDYRAITTKRAGNAAADFAKLGLAGVLYDQGKYDDASQLYTEVVNGELAKKMPEAKGRALEGLGLCLEAKNDLDGALKRYGELENAEIPGFRELSLYDQARLLHKKGDNAGAEERLKKVVDKLSKEKQPTSLQPGMEGQVGYLAEASRALLLSIDPAAVPAQSSEDALRKALEEFQRKLPPGVKSMPTPMPRAP